MASRQSPFCSLLSLMSLPNCIHFRSARALMPRCVDWPPPPPTHFVLIELRVDAVDAFVAAKHVREARGRRGLDVARAELHLASDAHRERLTHAICLESKEASFLLLTPNADRTVFLFLASAAAAPLLCAHTITRARTKMIRKPQPLSIERLTAGRTTIAWRRRLLCGAPLCSLACL